MGLYYGGFVWFSSEDFAFSAVHKLSFVKELMNFLDVSGFCWIKISLRFSFNGVFRIFFSTSKVPQFLFRYIRSSVVQYFPLTHQIDKKKSRYYFIVRIGHLLFSTLYMFANDVILHYCFPRSDKETFSDSILYFIVLRKLISTKTFFFNKSLTS